MCVTLVHSKASWDTALYIKATQTPATLWLSDLGSVWIFLGLKHLFLLLGPRLLEEPSDHLWSCPTFNPFPSCFHGDFLGTPDLLFLSLREEVQLPFCFRFQSLFISSQSSALQNILLVPAVPYCLPLWTRSFTQAWLLLFPLPRKSTSHLGLLKSHLSLESQWTASGSSVGGIKTWLYHLPSVWLWTRHSTILSLSSLTFKMKIQSKDV